MLGYILTGGFLAGYRTYLMAGLAVATALVGYADGDTDLVHTITNVVMGLGLGTLRAGVGK
jgi:hypothetical protein